MLDNKSILNDQIMLAIKPALNLKVMTIVWYDRVIVCVILLIHRELVTLIVLLEQPSCNFGGRLQFNYSTLLLVMVIFAFPRQPKKGLSGILVLVH